MSNVSNSSVADADLPSHYHVGGAASSALFSSLAAVSVVAAVTNAWSAVQIRRKFDVDKGAAFYHIHLDAAVTSAGCALSAPIMAAHVFWRSYISCSILYMLTNVAYVQGLFLTAVIAVTRWYYNILTTSLTVLTSLIFLIFCPIARWYSMLLARRNVIYNDSVSRIVARRVFACFILIYLSAFTVLSALGETFAVVIDNCNLRIIDTAQVKIAIARIAHSFVPITSAVIAIVFDFMIILDTWRNPAVGDATSAKRNNAKKKKKKKYSIPICATLFSSMSLVPNLVMVAVFSGARWVEPVAVMLGSLIQVTRCPLMTVMAMSAKVKTDVLNKTLRQELEREDARKAKEQRDMLKVQLSNDPVTHPENNVI